MQFVERVLQSNQRWAASHAGDDPGYFSRLQGQQSPEFMWIGCSDSRVPANQIVGMPPGNVFVHRNIANLVVHTDINCLSVLQYAVDVLQVQHVIVCGHYGCGGVQAALSGQSFGLIDNWLRHIKDVYLAHSAEMEELSDETQRWDRLCEINVLQQVANVCYTTIVQDAWRRGQALSVHGLIYDLRNGMLKDLTVSIEGVQQVRSLYRIALGSAPSF
ncbi:MAG: carbonate dehydratase [Caldilineales bacterium]